MAVVRAKGGQKLLLIDQDAKVDHDNVVRLMREIKQFTEQEFIFSEL